MLFNSLQFGLFFVAFYPLYLVLKRRSQNVLLLIASYFFYGAWDWRFLGLLVGITLVDYLCGYVIGRTQNSTARRVLLTIAVVANLVVLGIFKYFHFFAESFLALCAFFGWHVAPQLPAIILPIGLSFFTFQGIGYVVDVARRKCEPTHNVLHFALFIAFFPQLIAGPIERAAHLVPQFALPRRITRANITEGSFLILWGLFEKMVIADNLALLADTVFNSAATATTAQVHLATYAFAFQILYDFAGYSDIARGLAQLMGIDIMFNFRLPYFSRNPQEFWHRWHISLSQWLRDYLYIPLGGSRKGTPRTLINLTITMALGGLWHGAAWTYVLWGLYHGILLVLHRITAPFLGMVMRGGTWVRTLLWEPVKVLVFFHLVCIGWIFFRAKSLTDALTMFHSALQLDIASYAAQSTTWLKLLVCVVPVLIFEGYRRWHDDLLAPFKLPMPLRVLLYLGLFYGITIFGINRASNFVYFQF